jgi:putative thioredoxin
MDVSEHNFATAVIDRSHQLPVVVDFWAEWCGPCRQLGPTLERAAAARAGRLELVKIDVDANQALAQTYRIQSIPAVKAFRDGRVVSEFLGNQSPAAVDRFLDALVPSEADALVQAGDEASLRRALELEPGRADATLALARLLLDRGEPDEAAELARRLPGNFAAEGIVARVELARLAAREAGEARDGGEARDASEARDGGDARDGVPGLAEALSALDQADLGRALDLLITALPASDGHREDVRRLIVGILDELGVENPLAREGRRRLAAALY